jgi:hypothetical protein
LKLASQPGPSDLPVTSYSDPRNTEGIGGLVKCHPAEIFEFHDPCLPFVKRGEIIQSFIQCKEVDADLPTDGVPSFFKRQILVLAAALFTGSRSGVIDEYSPHGLSCDGKKMIPIGPLDLFLFDKLYESFMDKTRRL